MKRVLTMSIAILTVLFTCAATSLFVQGQVISETEEETLLTLYAEECAAMDLYAQFALEFESQVFARISEAEGRHVHAFENRMNQLGVEYTYPPPVPDWYSILLDPYPETLLDAYKVGGEIEETAISNLSNALGEVVSEVLIGLYQKLEEAEGNHLNAFVRHVELYGEEYVPQVLTEEELQEILDLTTLGPHEHRYTHQYQGENAECLCTCDCDPETGECICHCNCFQGDNCEGPDGEVGANGPNAGEQGFGEGPNGGEPDGDCDGEGPSEESSQNGGENSGGVNGGENSGGRNGGSGGGGGH